MRKPLTVIIVTLSVVCTLKGMSRQSIQKIKAMLLCIEWVSCLSTLSIRRLKQTMHLMLCLSTLSIHTLVFVALTQHLIQVWKLCIKWPLAPAKREGYCIVWAFRRRGFSCSPVSQSEEAALLTFLDLSNYKGDCWQDAQPIPNS